MPTHYHTGTFLGYIDKLRSAVEYVFPRLRHVEPPPPKYAYQLELEYVWEADPNLKDPFEGQVDNGEVEWIEEEEEREEEPTANVDAAAEDEANASNNENVDAPIDGNAVEPTGEDEPLAEEPAVEAPTVAARPRHPSRALRRRDTTIIDVFEDEYIPEGEGVAFEDGQGDLEKEPLPIALVIGDVPFVKVGDFLLRAGSRKRPRSADGLDEDAGANEAGPSTSHKDDENERPVKRHRRCVIPTEEKRLPDAHEAIKDAVCDAMDVDDLERLQYQQEPSDVRMMWLGIDGLDDGPTPPGTPQRTVTTVVEYDFA